MVAGQQPHGRRAVEAKTADYTVIDQDMGTRFTTTGGGGARVFTMPDPASFKGEWVEFFNTVNQNMTVKAGSSGHKFIVFNDLTATSVAYATSNNKIGSGFRLTSDGLVWMVETINAAAGAATVGAGIAKSAPVTIGT